MKDILVIIFLMSFITTGALFGINVLKKKQCSSRADVMNVDYQHSAWLGCFVKYQGNWIAYDKIKVLTEE